MNLRTNKLYVRISIYMLAKAQQSLAIIYFFSPKG